MSEQTVKKILDEYQGDSSDIIAMFQDIQEKYSYLPEEVLTQLADLLQVPLSRAYSIATFYKAFTLKPRGKHPISVCLGTACHVRGGQRVLERIQRELNLKVGETSPDLKFSLETVRCLGCCGLAPVVTVGDELYGQVTPLKAVGILNQYRSEEESE